MTAVTAAIALPAVAVVLFLRRIDVSRHWLGALTRATILGIGLSSIVWWALLLLPIASRRAVIAADVAVWTTTLAILLKWRRAAATSPLVIRAPERARRTVVLLFVLTAGLASVAFVAASVAQPHGEWDAWAIWNLRARFLYLGYPLQWREAFSPSLAWSHPDYPLLLPLSVARAWAYAGHERVLVPIAVAAIFAIGTVATASLSIARARSRSYGLLTGAMIMAAPAFVKYAPSQCADIPLACYMLATMVAAAEAFDSPSSRPAWLITGASAGLAAWTKNEGMLFLVVFVAALLIREVHRDGWSGLRPVILVILGASPMIVAVVALESFAPASDLLAGQSLRSVWIRLSDIARVNAVALGIGRELWFGGAVAAGVLPIVAVFVLTLGRQTLANPAPRVGLATMLVVVAGYAAVYVITPHDLGWHMKTSLDRVLLQVFPTLVWCGMMIART